MDSVGQQRVLIDKLVSLSNERRLDWSLSNDGDPFARLGEYFVILKEGGSASGSTLLKVVIEDKEENEIDSFDDEDLDNNPGGKYYSAMVSLLNTARRQAKGSDKAINEILKNLDDL